jgi:hypothetical protein
VPSVYSEKMASFLDCLTVTLDYDVYCVLGCGAIYSIR